MKFFVYVTVVTIDNDNALSINKNTETYLYLAEFAQSSWNSVIHQSSTSCLQMKLWQKTGALGIFSFSCRCPLSSRSRYFGGRAVLPLAAVATTTISAETERTEEQKQKKKKRITLHDFNSVTSCFHSCLHKHQSIPSPRFLKCIFLQ